MKYTRKGIIHYRQFPVCRLCKYFLHGQQKLLWKVSLSVASYDDGKGSLKSETVKYGRESQWTRTRERICWQRPAACTKDGPVLSSERAPHKEQDCNCETVINIWSWAILTDWLNVSRNVTMTSTRRQSRGVELRVQFCMGGCEEKILCVVFGVRNSVRPL
jgi:hypothetical protein